MILFNITLLSDLDIHEDLKSWILTDFFTNNSKEGFFKSQALLKVIDSPNEGITYSMQFIATNQDVISEFRIKSLPLFHKKVREEYPNKVFFFESTMEYQMIL